MWQRSPKSQKEKIMKFQIEGYEEMTPEQKVAALEAYEPDMSGYVAKATFDKAASDLAAAKKSLREKMSEDEAKAAEREAKFAEITAELETLRHEKMVGTYVASYLAMGYDEKLAKATAEAMAKGDTDTVFKNQKLHLENREKALRTELLKNTPTPAGGNTDTGMTKEQFSKMSLAEKARFAEENPETYKEFYGGN
jgi:hypothetical protein